MLKNWFAKLGLGRHSENESYGAATESREARRVQDGIDSSGRTPRVDESPPEQTGEEPPTGSES
jgi:hypothetical protein